MKLKTMKEVEKRIKKKHLFNEKYVGKRIFVPSLGLNFTLYAKQKDAEQFDKYFNFLISMWKQSGQGNDVKVFGYLKELEKAQ